MTSPIRLAADSRMEAIAQLKRLQDDLEAQFAGQHALSVAGRMSHFGIKMKEEGRRTAPFQTGTLQMSHRSLTTLQKLDAHVHQVTTSIFIDPDGIVPVDSYEIPEAVRRARSVRRTQGSRGPRCRRAAPGRDPGRAPPQRPHRG